jgi:hypothetical protein
MLQVRYFSNIGGASLKSMTKRIMKDTLQNSLAVQFNWTGAKTKMAFGSLKLCSAVCSKLLQYSYFVDS